MKLVTIDFETYYDNEFSLSKMSTEDYVNDPRFEIIGVAIKVGDGATTWHPTHAGAAAAIEAIDWHAHAMLCHHTMFDALVVQVHTDAAPARFYMDTKSMAQATLKPFTGSASLAAVSRYLHLGEKGREVIAAKGKRITDFQADELHAYGGYCINDVELTYKIFKRMMETFPASELYVIDRTLRMYLHPVIELDTELLAEHLEEVRARKDYLLNNLPDGVTPESLMSNPQLADVLRHYGVEPPMKVSPTTGKPALAMAKTDPEFLALCEHEDEQVQAIMAARLGTKSTIAETRTERFLEISRRYGKLRVPLVYYGAHTGRWSGTEGINVQNLPRKSALRRALIAPEGHSFVVADFKQIEARVLAWAARQSNLVDAFAAGDDVYSLFAAVLFRKPVDQVDEHERFIGKTCLGAGTQVLTRRGWVPIVEVRLDDQLWDGVEWVSHQGVSYMGRKQTINLHGVELTPDHEILTAPTRWEAAHAAHANSHVFQSAVDLATSLLSGMKNTWPRLARIGGGDHCAPASDAAVYTPTLDIISALGVRPPATLAPSEKPVLNAGGSTRAQWPTTSTARACLIGYLQQSLAAITRAIGFSITTVGVGLRSIASGVTTLANSLSMSRPCPVGMTPPSRWTARTTTKGTAPAISGLPRAARTQPTSEKSPTLRPVYDILNSGSRSRFTVHTDAGPIIVHNCVLGLGYGMGHVKFQTTLLTKGVSWTDDEVKQAVDLYRTLYSDIRNFWHMCDRMLAHIARATHVEENWSKTPITTGPQCVFLPNGLPLVYNHLQVDGNGDWSYKAGNRWHKIYGAKATENWVQGVARIIMTDAEQKIDYPMVLTVHDELVFCVPDEHIDFASRQIETRMVEQPEWAVPFGPIPLAVELSVAKRYGDAK